MNTNALWHPFAPMHRVRNQKTTIVRADDVWVWDDKDRRYLDGTAGLWYVNAGHGRKEIIDAVTRQLNTLDAYHVFADFANKPALDLADAIAERAPVDDAKVFLTSGGGDSIDTAAKLARMYFALNGFPERTILLHRENGYHGTHGSGTALAGIAANRLGGPFVPDVHQVSRDDAGALEQRILELGADKVAAFFCEPVIGAGGVHPPVDGYIEAVAEICQRHGVLFVLDSVICAFGRLGNWFGAERWNVRPDMITFAKGVTSGYQPLGGVVISGRIAAPFWEEAGAVFRHGPTYSGHPAACAAALAAFDIYERDGLFDRANQLEKPLLERLESLTDHPLIDHARGGVGFLGALEFAQEHIGDNPGLPQAVSEAARKHGVLIRPAISALAVSPPLTATEDHLDQIAEAVRAALDDTYRG